MIYDDLEPCPHGARIRFVYDYNMEFANAFPSQVDCLTVLFYDKEGKYVATRTNTSSDLADENWRMEVDLAPGSYDILAYGGLACPEASFHFVSPPEETRFSDIRVEMNSDCITHPKGTELHPLFYGKAEVEVAESDLDYREITVYMMRDTNNLRIVLQQIDGDPLDNEDFEFNVIDDNTLFGVDNNLIPAGTIDYFPWARGNASPGEIEGHTSTVAWAELSLSRLTVKSAPTLVVTRKSDGFKIIDIPLINYLALLKSEHFADMGLQEYLDREWNWNMIFFLDRHHLWVRTQIIVNGWVVRINSTDF